jgi:DNA-binding NtrC family response regulator
MALVVDDDEDFRSSLAMLVAREGFGTEEADTLARARELLAGTPFDVVVVDLGLPDGDGLEILQDSGLRENAEVVVVTGNASMQSAVSALREGVSDYLTKPLDHARLKTVLANVARTRGLKQEVKGLRRELRELGRFGPMVGRSKAMQDVYDLVSRVAATQATVLVTGESGTGKELVAETIHRLSSRKDQPFLGINCGAMSPTLIESELFGHEKGSFTGADRRRAGCFERAHGGTLLLDEITEMPVELQVKLLRVLETGVLHRVGGTQALPVDVRVIAASNRNPERAVEEGALREDLYFRLNVFPIALPPLRERGDDVALLAEHYLAEINESEGTRKRWTPAALRRLSELPWTGNVRELRNAVQRAYILAEEEIGPEALPVADHSRLPTPQERRALEVRVGCSIADVERRLILATLEELGGDKRQAAQTLGISLKTLYNRLAVYRAREES